MGGTDGGGDATGLQFDRVELDAEAARACQRCKRAIRDEYFESVGTIVCGACAATLGSGAGPSGAFLRALAFGAGASLVGSIIWYTFIKVTGSELGIIAIAIGLIVGIAVRRGSRGRGGWKYQALAMALTYVSITSSYIPFVVKGLAEGAHSREDARKKSDLNRGEASESMESQPVQEKTHLTAGGVALAFAMVFALAFAAPFLGGASNIMGLVIIGIALYEAWKINRHVPLSGPFRIAASAQGPPTATAPPASPA